MDMSRWIQPARIQLYGDTAKAQQLLGVARQQIGVTRNLMGFQSLKQLVRKVDLGDGIEMRVGVIHGQAFAEIYVPPMMPTVYAPEVDEVDVAQGPGMASKRISVAVFRSWDSGWYWRSKQSILNLTSDFEVDSPDLYLVDGEPQEKIYYEYYWAMMPIIKIFQSESIENRWFMLRGLGVGTVEGPPTPFYGGFFSPFHKEQIESGVYFSQGVDSPEIAVRNGDSYGDLYGSRAYHTIRGFNYGPARLINLAIENSAGSLLGFNHSSHSDSLSNSTDQSWADDDIKCFSVVKAPTSETLETCLTAYEIKKKPLSFNFSGTNTDYTTSGSTGINDERSEILCHCFHKNTVVFLYSRVNYDAVRVRNIAEEFETFDLSATFQLRKKVIDTDDYSTISDVLVDSGTYVEELRQDINPIRNFTNIISGRPMFGWNTSFTYFASDVALFGTQHYKGLHKHGTVCPQEIYALLPTNTDNLVLFEIYHGFDNRSNPSTSDGTFAWENFWSLLDIKHYFCFLSPSGNRSNFFYFYDNAPLKIFGDGLNYPFCGSSRIHPIGAVTKSDDRLFITWHLGLVGEDNRLADDTQSHWAITCHSLDNLNRLWTYIPNVNTGNCTKDSPKSNFVHPPGLSGKMIPFTKIAVDSEANELYFAIDKWVYKLNEYGSLSFGKEIEIPFNSPEDYSVSAISVSPIQV
jgi:hypothetical protein